MSALWSCEGCVRSISINYDGHQRLQAIGFTELPIRDPDPAAAKAIAVVGFGDFAISAAGCRAFAAFYRACESAWAHEPVAVKFVEWLEHCAEHGGTRCDV